MFIVADYSALIVYLLSCDCKCSVTLPHSVTGLQFVIVVFSGLLGLRIALSIAAYPMIYLTYREQNSLYQISLLNLLKIVDATTQLCARYFMSTTDHLIYECECLHMPWNSLITSKSP